MSDTISKMAVLDKFLKICDSCGEYEKHNGVMCGTCYLDGAISIVEDMPSAQPELRWIPCSKKLPSDEDYDETFTVTIQCEHYDGWDDYVTGYADWTPHGWDIQSYYMGQIKVVAWMQMPEPYKENEDG